MKCTDSRFSFKYCPLRQYFDVQTNAELAGLLHSPQEPYYNGLPGGIGVPKVTVPTEKVPLNAPPFGCDGGCSSVVPRTVMTEVPVPQG